MDAAPSAQLPISGHLTTVEEAPRTRPGRQSTNVDERSTLPARNVEAEPVANLADVLAALGAKEKTSRNKDMRSAVRTVIKACRRPGSAISVKPAELAQVLREATPALVGVSEGRWRNAVSSTRAALRECGIAVMPGRDRMGLSDSWRVVVELLPERRFRVGMSRMLSYFTRSGLTPTDVTASHFDDYHQELLTNSLHRSPEAAFRTSVRLWNQAVTAVPGWPKLNIALEPDPRRYSLPWVSFPATFLADVEAYLTHTGNQDPLSDDYARPVATKTTDGRRKTIQQLASALLKSGLPPDSLTSLAVLVELENAKRALRYLLERNGGETTPNCANQAYLIRTIAKYWVKAPESDVKALKKIASNLSTEKRGMVAKNRERLRQFDAPEHLATLLALPARVLGEVAKNPTGSYREAVRVMYGLAVEILTMAPLRRENLTSLELGRHVLEVGHGATRRWKIVIPAGETKTRTPIEMSLPDESRALLEAYLSIYRARLGHADSVFLFPGRGGQRRSADAFGRTISEFILRETGLKMNVHLFRHLAGKIYLEAHPDDIATVSRILTHRSTATTEKVYIEHRAEDGMRRYDETISRLRGAATGIGAL
ncbi:MAG: tyrosine-type recombinase/integrase [Caulobacter sp.]|nr:tyrosine-type recombinase/integrase [Caulobacter sp.]